MNKSVTEKGKIQFWILTFQIFQGHEALIYFRAKTKVSYDLYQKRDRQEKDGWTYFCCDIYYENCFYQTVLV